MTFVEMLSGALVGAKLVEVRPATPEEMAGMGWYGDYPSTVLVFEHDDRQRIQVTAMRDPEGNGPGALSVLGASHG